MKIKRIKFNMELSVIIVSFIIIATAFYCFAADRFRIFDPVDTASANTVTQTLTKEEKETVNLAEKLKKDGFPEKDITEAINLSGYIGNKLDSICQVDGMDQTSIPKPEAIDPLAEDTSKKEDLTAYKKLAEKFDTNVSVEMMVKMKNDFGSIGNVMDEYLFSLQAEINLKDYIGKAEEYRKIKEEKSKSLPAEDMINTQKIDEKLLTALKKQNKNPDAGGQDVISGKLPQAGSRSNIQGSPNSVDPLPKVPQPELPNQPGVPVQQELPNQPGMSNRVPIPDNVIDITGTTRSGVSGPNTASQVMPGQPTLP